MEIRLRQTMFLIKDKIHNKANTKSTTLSTGSLALPGSDMDVNVCI
jgi:hypothetical protein